MLSAKWFFSGVLMLLINVEVFSQQLKLGKNPSLIEKSAVLELQSDNQGLLFPRLTDTLLINALNVPDGMVIFHKPSLQLLLRSGGYWKPLTVSAALNNYWSLNGNSGSNAASQFLGTTDLRSFTVRTNNVQSLFLDSLGNIAAGSAPLFTAGTNREKFLVDAGTTSSFNVISGKGTIDNYLQLNIQNRSSGTSASSDLVATADNGTEAVNYVDLGINSSGFTNATYPVLGGINNAYLYSTGNDFIIGNATASKNLRLFTGGYATTNERMRIDGNGNVGIGITAPTAALHLKAGTISAGTAPLKFSTGPLLTTAEAGAMEFLTDKFYGTISTGAARKEFTLNESTLSSGRIPYANASGRLTDNALMTFSGTRLSPNYLTLAAGTATAGTAPFVMTPGTSLTTPQPGAVEFDGTHFYGTVGSIRYQLDQQAPTTTGSNTGDQTITLTGDVTGSGTGTFPATISSNAVTYAKLQQIAASKLLGNPTGALANASEISLGTGLSFVGSTLTYTPATSGTVSSVGLSLPSIFTVTNSPVTASGTLTGTLATQAANLVFAGPLTGAATAPTFRSLVAADLPLATTSLVGGIKVGTGLAVAAGVLSTTSAAPSGAAGGDLTGTYPNPTLATVNTNTGVFGSTTVVPQITVNGKGLITAVSPQTIAFPVTSVNTSTGAVSLGIANMNDATITTPATNQVLQYNGTKWVNTTPSYISTAITSLNGLTAATQTFATPGTSGTAPAWSSTGSVHTLNIPLASATSVTAGLLSNTDWTTFNNKLSTIDTTNISNFYIKSRSLLSAGSGIGYNSSTGVISNSGVLSVNGNLGALTMDTTYISGFAQKTRSLFAGTAPITYSNGQVGITQASGSTNGYLSSADWNTFNSKVGSVTAGNLTETASGILTITGGTGAVLGSGTTVQVKQATGSQSGFLSSTDWTTFNSKQSALTLGNVTGTDFGITGGTGAVVGSGLALSLATVNTNTGTFGSTTVVPQLTVNGKGLITAVSPQTIAFPVTSVNTSTGAVSLGIANMNDATITTPATNQVLQYNGTKWVNTTPSYISTAITSLNGLTAAIQTFATPGTSGTAPAWSSTGSVHTLNLPLASAASVTAGLLSNTDWTTFNNKLSTIDTTNISNFYIKVRSEHSAGAGISYNSSTGVIANSGVLSVNGNVGALTMDTTYISSFAQKTRSLFAGTAPITYSNGQVGITQASGSTNGYLSSADWNTFNSKIGSVTAGNLTETGSGILTITGGTGAVLGSGTTVQVKQATGSQSGFLSSTDWTTFNNKLSTIDTTNISNFYIKSRSLLSAGSGIGYNSSTGVISNSGVLSVNGNIGALTMDTTYISSFAQKTRSLFAGTAPITYSNGQVGITQASGSTNGYLSSADWNTFNSKVGSVTAGNLTETGSGILTITGGTGAVLGSGTTVQVKQATGSQSGFLSSTDWTTFNSKQSALTLGNVTGTDFGITGGTGAVVGSGLALSLATVNTNTGTFGSTTVVPQLTVNGKGLITAVSPQTIAFPVTSVNTSTGAVSLGIANMNDATITTPATNQVLQYNGTKWVNTTPSYISSAITSLNGLTAATQTFATPGTSGTAPAWSSTGSVHTLNLPLASAASVTAGLLSNTDWTTFNNKLSTIDTTNISNFYIKVRSEHSAGAGISYNSSTGVIANSGVLSVNGNVGALTMDTTYISSFAQKTRSLFAGTAPITYSNGQVGITQASGSTNGYLSSADWNTFNSKIGSVTAGNLTETGSGILTITGGTGAVLGSGTTVQVKQATGSQSGFLSSTDWTTFNNKLSTIDTTNISNFYLKVRSEHSAGAGISYNSSTGVIANSGVLSVNGNIGALTMDTTYISSFAQKTRSLFAGTAPITYSNGQVGITQASGSTNGYLSSADWNTFNSKLGSVSSGNLTETGSGILTITGGTGAVLGSGTTVQVKQATGSQSGFLSSTDWTTFNNKLSTVDTTNISNFYIKSRSLVSAGTGITYNSATGVISSSVSTANSWAYNGNTVGAIKTFGTIDNFALPFITNNTEKMRLTAAGFLGIGNTSPGNYLDISGTLAATGVSGLRLNGLGAATAAAANSKVLSVNSTGDVIVTTNPAASLWSFTGNSGLNPPTNFLGMIDDKQMVLKSNNQSFLEFGRRQTLGLVQTYPDYSDPDEKVTYVRSALQFEAPAASFYKPKIYTDSSGNFRIKGSSAGTDYFEMGSTGTNNNGGFEFIIGDDGDEPMVFKSYNYLTGLSEIMRLQSGRMAVGSNAFDATNPEKLLIDAGATTSYNLMTGKGSIDNYLQINVKNSSATANASSDLVASSDNGNENVNFIDMGINSSVYSNTSNPILNGANNAYIYATGNDFLFGNGTASKSLLFFTGGTSLSNERMRIDGSGNVGIGISAPTNKLSILGTNPLYLSGVQTGLSSDSLLTITGGVVRKILASSLSGASTAWSLTGNAATNPSTNFLGTTDAQALVFKVNNAQIGRMEQTSVALGTSASTNISTNSFAFGNAAALGYNISNAMAIGTSATANIASTFVIGNSAISNSNNGGNSFAIGNSSSVNSTNSFAIGPSATTAYGITDAVAIGYNATSNSSNSIALGSNSTAASKTTTNGAGAIAFGNNNQANSSGAVSIGQATSVGYSSTNSMALGSGATIGSSITNSTAIGTNASAASSNTIIIGDKSNTALSVGIGSEAFASPTREKLMVDAGTSAANDYLSVIGGKGTSNNYLQINIQNKSAGTAASSDVVATNDGGTEQNLLNFVDMGINSSGNTSTGPLGGASTAYLYGTGNDFSIGNATSAKALKFFTGGTADANERMRIDGSGNIGIANTSPVEKLDITGNIRLNGSIIPTTGAPLGTFLQSMGNGVAATWLNPTVALNGISWGVNGNSSLATTNFLGTTDNVGLYMRTNNTQRLFIDNTGNVAVGTGTSSTTPPAFTASPNQEKFLVDAGTNTGNNFINVISGRATTNNYIQLNIQNKSAGTAASSDVVATNDAGTESVNYIDMGINSSGNTSTGVLGGANNAYLYGTGTDMAIGNSGTGALKLFTGASEDMRIDASGNVGIGTTSPAQKLDVTGNANISGSIWVDGANANSGTTSPALLFGNNTTGESIASKRTSGGNQYGLDLYTNNTNRMAILQGGNVGIGTTTPAEKLTVSGNISTIGNVLPSVTNTYSLGSAALKWNNIYSANLLIVSDKRLKTNINKLNYGLKEILALEPVTYNWKTTPESDKQVGLIAQEVRQLIPEAVSGEESKEDLGINYIKIIPVLINAIKEQQKQIDDLKQQIIKLQK